MLDFIEMHYDAIRARAIQSYLEGENTMSNRGNEWKEFSNAVLNHVENYTVPQYGDAPNDNASSFTEKDIIKHIQRYLHRVNSNARGETESIRDCIKIAHYACMLHTLKTKNKKSVDMTNESLDLTFHNFYHFYKQWSQASKDSEEEQTALKEWTSRLPVMRNIINLLICIYDPLEETVNTNFRKATEKEDPDNAKRKVEEALQPYTQPTFTPIHGSC